MKKFLAIVLCLAMCASIFIGCAQQQTAATETKKLKVFTILADGSNQSNSDMVLHTKEVLEAAGHECTNLYYEANVAKQREQIENAIAAQANAIILQPQDTTTNEDVLQQAVDAGIMVICFDVPLDNVNYSYCHLAGNDALGRVIGGEAVKWAQINLVDKGIPVVCGFLAADFNAEIIKRTEGEIAAIKEAIPDAQIVMRADAYTADMGAECAENFLTAYPEMNVLCCINDGGALGFYETLSSMNLPGEFGIFSTDALPAAITDIAADKYFKTTIDLSLNDVGVSMANEIMKCFIEGDKSGLESRTNIEFPMVVINKDNAHEWLD